MSADKLSAILLGLMCACFTLAALSFLTAMTLGRYYSEPWIFFVNFGLPLVVWAFVTGWAWNK